MSTTIESTASTGAILSEADYGKADIRLVKLFRAEQRHRLKDVQIRVLLRGDFQRGYVDGDNAQWLSTDTIRNICYATARTGFETSIEEFGIEIARQIIEVAPLVREATIELVEHRWSRIVAGGQPRDDAFVRDAGLRTATVSTDGEAHRLSAGIRDYTVLRTAGSGWEGYLKDRFTTLPETDDRILATTIEASWDYASNTQTDFDSLWDAVLDQILITFSDHYSRGVQSDIYLIGRAVLDRFEQIERIHMSLPNLHHLLFDLGRFGLDNDNQVFHAARDPYGLLRGTVARS